MTESQPGSRSREQVRGAYKDAGAQPIGRATHHVVVHQPCPQGSEEAHQAAQSGRYTHERALFVVRHTLYGKRGQRRKDKSAPSSVEHGNHQRFVAVAAHDVGHDRLENGDADDVHQREEKDQTQGAPILGLRVSVRAGRGFTSENRASTFSVP
jgi:hypothetical protein